MIRNDTYYEDTIHEQKKWAEENKNITTFKNS